MKARSIAITLALAAAATASSPSQPGGKTGSDTVLARDDSSNQDIEAVADNVPEPSDDPGNTCPTVKFVNPVLTFGPTRTVYTATATTTETLDCGPCTALKASTLALGLGPLVSFSTTITAAQPSYTTEYVCATHAAAAARHVQGNLGGEDGWPNTMSTITPPGVTKPACTSQTQLEPVIPDSTSTVYPGTSTVVSEIDCGGCAVEWDTGVVYFFAPVIQTATTTVATASTKVELACATTA
ncbi:hypothetical protein ACRE_056930 [Hapsidospora chrysogenum ATCC 11550]|uniref:Uncharacterized protein n=1 Tax=Hapsidospora chrysogenum (strain ATCC 11550 / CBS 779.69 / DSM 880 / IAM 14645 / JCM 23072 / IMI 49137) TaxID=857340 RepID=A0A086T2G2_HAPC1|nr:hypothetical protein ACRE_056930 [Hapsidospora chrysogenum ATCC 11550]